MVRLFWLLLQASNDEDIVASITGFTVLRIFWLL